MWIAGYVGCRRGWRWKAQNGSLSALNHWKFMAINHTAATVLTGLMIVLTQNPMGMAMVAL